MGSRGGEGRGVVDLPDIPQEESAIFVPLDVPVAVEVEGEGRGGALLTQDILYSTTGRRCCGEKLIVTVIDEYIM